MTPDEKLEALAEILEIAPDERLTSVCLVYDYLTDTGKDIWSARRIGASSLINTVGLLEAAKSWFLNQYAEVPDDD